MRRRLVHTGKRETGNGWHLRETIGSGPVTGASASRLGNGDLWIWSPVKLTAVLRTDVDRLGRFEIS
jgi:hypothetical protein